MNYKESFVSYDGGVLWSCESGSSDAPSVILCSGGPGCCDYLEPVAKIVIIKEATHYVWLDNSDGLSDILNKFLCECG